MELKRGRPRNKPKSATELISNTKALLMSTRQSKQAQQIIDTEDVLIDLMDLGEMKRKSYAELKELRRKATILWDDYIEAREIDAQMVLPFNSWMINAEKSDSKSATSLISPMQWDKQHHFLKPKRKNAKKTKTIYNFQLLGNGSQPLALLSNKQISMQEKILQDRWMDDNVRKRNDDRKFLVGRRVRERGLSAQAKRELG